MSPRRRSVGQQGHSTVAPRARSGSHPTPAFCVHCGNPVQSLYRRYSATVLKVMSCTHCKQIADKYIEYDPVIVLIDLVLLNKQAFRHILYNTQFSQHWKLAVVMVLIEGYALYDSVSQPSSNWEKHSIKTDAPKPADLLDGERLFYLICVESLLASTAFFGTVMFLSWGLRPPELTPLLLWKALVLGSFGTFLIVPSLIWREPGREWIDATFIWSFTFLSLLQVHSVACRTSRLLSAMVVALGLAAKLGSRGLLRGLQLKLPFE